MNQPICGIDLGGTKIEGVILRSVTDPTPIVRTRIDTEASRGYEHIVSQMARLVAEMEKASGLKPRAIGIGTPGVLDPTLQTMKNCNTVVLNGKPLKKDIENALQLHIEMANDANCFALAETQWGVVRRSAPGARLVFGIIMGTGVGGGIVMDGKIWNGRHGIGGEWGHNFLDESGGPCYCGKTGCVEQVLSGPALEKFYTGVTGKKKNLKDIYTSAQNGSDPVAVKTMERLVHFFGMAL